MFFIFYWLFFSPIAEYLHSIHIIFLFVFEWMQNIQDSYFPLYSIWKLSEVFPLHFYISVWLGTSTRIFLKIILFTQPLKRYCWNKLASDMQKD